MIKITIIYRIALARDTLRNSLIIAFVVGTLLNLLNQGTPLIALNFNTVNWFTFGLTYAVPYIVSTYTGTAARLRFDPGVRAAYTASLQCKDCGEQRAVAENDMVPECGKCKTNTKWQITAIDEY